MWSQLHAKEKLRGETFVYPEDVNMCYEQYLIRNKQHLPDPGLIVSF